jgi:apolipoprotein N-acyltransferase
MRAAGAAGLTGLLLFASFPPLGLWPLAFVAWVPLLVTLPRLASARRALLTGWLAGAVWFSVVFYWVHHTLVTMSGLPGPAAATGVLLFGAFQGLSLGLWAWLAHRAGAARALSIDLGLAIAWGAIEMGFLWIFPLPVATPLYHAPLLIQVVDLVGVHGLSALLVLFNLCLARAISDRASRRAALAAAAAVAVALVAYGGLRLAWPQAETDDRLRVGWVQPAVLPHEKRARDLRVRYKVLEREMRALDALIASDPEIDALVLPEGAFPFYFQDDASDDTGYPPRVREWATRYLSWPKTSGRPLLFGSLRKVDAFTRNSAILARPDGSVLRYDKRVMVPFGERIPLADHLPFLKNKVMGMSHLSRGTQPAMIDLAGRHAHLSICYEAIFPVLIARESGDADLLVNLTNDEWFGDTSAPEMHLMSQVFRAVETRLPLVRVTNTGISAWVDPHGIIHGRTGLFTEERGVWDIPIAHHPTLFGAAPVAVTVGLGMIGLLALILGIRGRRRRRSDRAREGPPRSSRPC